MRGPSFFPLLLSALLTLPVLAQETNRTAELFKEFDRRVKEYAKLHKEVQRGLPPLKEKADAAQIAAHKKLSGEAIRGARQSAKQGDMFFPEIRPEFVKILNSELKGPGSSTAKSAIKEEGKIDIKIGINQPYPENQPVTTVPPMLLLKLPKLPEDLEYRFANHSLILRDTTTGLIIDYLPGVFR